MGYMILGVKLLGNYFFLYGVFKIRFFKSCIIYYILLYFKWIGNMYFVFVMIW